MPNAIVQGSELTPEAFRLLTYIASLPEDWSLRIAQAGKRCLMGRDRTYNALRDLEQLQLARLMGEKASNGRIIRQWWEFTLTPGQWKAPLPENPDTADGVHILKFRNGERHCFLKIRIRSKTRKSTVLIY
jgi:hypothetical protein